MSEVHASAYVLDRREVELEKHLILVQSLLQLHVTGYGLFYPLAWVASDATQEKEDSRRVCLLAQSEEKARELYSRVNGVPTNGVPWHYISPELARTIAVQCKGRHFECYFSEGMLSSYK